MSLHILLYVLCKSQPSPAVAGFMGCASFRQVSLTWSYLRTRTYRVQYSGLLTEAYLYPGGTPRSPAREAGRGQGCIHGATRPDAPGTGGPNRGSAPRMKGASPSTTAGVDGSISIRFEAANRSTRGQRGWLAAFNLIDAAFEHTSHNGLATRKERVEEPRNRDNHDALACRAIHTSVPGRKSDRRHSYGTLL